MRTRSIRLPITVIILLLNYDILSAQYCIPNSNPGYGTNIDKVVIQDISTEHLWISGDPGYFDYTESAHTNLKRAQSFTITITRGYYYSNMQYAAWIDYNDDGDFADTGEKLGQVGTSSASTTILITFTVPSASLIGDTRLRIRSVYNISNLDPCTNYSYGETEDYTIGITDFVIWNTGITDGGSGEITLFNYDSDSDYDLFVQDEYSDTDPFSFFNYSTGAYSLFDYIDGTIPEPNNDNLSYNFGDLNNDNALDLLLTYRYSSDFPRTLYYQKQSGILKQVTTGMINLMRGQVATADLDNDGRQDVIINGEDNSGLKYTNVYKNTSTGFVLIDANLKGVRGKIVTADFDNDNDIDILLTGDDRYSNTNAILYRNDNNWKFTNTMTDLMKINWLQTAGSGDFNSDGLTDLFIGNRVYMNGGKNLFTEVPIVCPEFYEARCWFDMENDGFLELVGKDYSGIVILKYDGTNFIISQHLYIPSMDLYNTGDYNDDNKQDILFNLYNNVFYLVNNTLTANNAPTPPSNTSLRSSVGGAGYYTVKLTWGDGSDDHTPASGLTYNLRVGTTSTGNDIMSSMTSISDYSLLKPGFGNTGSNNSWILRNLAPGTYYWSVQTVDNTGVASPFSQVRSFVIEPPLTATSFDVDGLISAAGTVVDFDCDQSMDLILQDSLLVINEQTAPLTYTYHKVRRSASLIEIRDLNNDNKPDLVARHNRKPGTELKDSLVLLINNGDFSFQYKKIDTLNFSSSSSADFDNDGDIDILAYSKGLYIFKNNGSLNYTRIKLDLSDKVFNQYTAVSSIDIDADNDIDILISGKEASAPNGCYTYIYKNSGNLNFVLSQVLSPGLGPTGFAPVASVRITIVPDIAWNDHNLDGFPDLLISGDDFYNNTNNIIYINDGTGKFVITDISPRPSDKFSTSWIDFNKDAKLDLIMPKIGLSVDNCIYLNQDSSTYQAFETILDNNDLLMYLDLGDIDNDRDKDIILTYKYSTGPLTYRPKTTIYSNTFNFANSPPSPPSTTQAVIDSFTVHLKWTNGTDYLMGKKGFSYNIWVGTSPTNPDIVSPLSDLTTGYRFVEDLGNAGTNNSWTLKNLPLGKYYWSVQTIDNSLQGSSWAPVSTFEISALTADFTTDVVCLGEDTHFTDGTVSTQPVSAYYWDFGGGNHSTVQNPVFKFTKAGNNSVKLIVTAGAIIDSVRKDVFVKPVPLASFTAPDECQGETTAFTNTTALRGTTISSWSWDFGDEGSSTLQDPGNHGYLLPGSYTVSLTAIATNGCSDSYSDDIHIGAYPVAAITANAPLTFCKGDSVKLSVQLNTTYSYNWLLNGTFITGEITNEYVAKSSGSYVATVTNPVGNCATSSPVTVISVLDAPASPVIVTDRPEPVEFCQADSVGLSVTAVDGQFYSWRLNGGAVGPNRNTFSAKLPGTYGLFVANSSGCSAVSVNKITVTVNPLPSVSSVSLSGSTEFCSGESLLMSVTPTTGYSYQWSNASGPISGASSNSYSASSSGQYRLRVTNQSGCYISSPPITVLVKEMPSLPVIVTENYQAGKCSSDGTITLRVDQTVQDYSYRWKRNGTIMDNSSSSSISGYIPQGDYTVEANNNGCISESAPKNIVYAEAPEKPKLFVQGPVVWYMAASNDKAAKYRWYRNDQLIQGADRFIYLANKTLGTYKVAVGNIAGCFTMSDPVTIPVSKSEMTSFKIPAELKTVENIDPFGNIKIYPNPTPGLFTIEMDNSLIGELNIEILSQEGRKILNIKFEKTTDHFKSEVDLSGQAKGMYIINLLLNNFAAIRKVMVE